MMSDRRDDSIRASQLEALDESLTTPAGLQANAVLWRRRLFVLAANILVWGGLVACAAGILGADGWTLLDLALLALFAGATPWAVLGFCNAIIGLWLLHARRDPLGEVGPFVAAGRSLDAVRISTAVLMTLRNEDPERAFARLKTVKGSLDATGEGHGFSYFVLSDTTDPDIARREAACMEAWRTATGQDGEKLHYRRRDDNAGFKAGNVRDFCQRWGQDFEVMVPLDADSLMTGEAIVSLVRIMQAHPKIGILQSLVVGMPSSSPFARVFQFGMRFGMRTYTMGQSWWVGDCGPYWGHNAVVRIEPFTRDCHLPVIPGGPPFGGSVLSHDQVEAALMRRAGYEVRVMPIEGGSFEENPPNVLEFIRRDVRWCQGNMQYSKLLGLPGLLAISRFQLVWAILMFVGTPAFTAMIALAPMAAYQAANVADFPTGAAAALYVSFLVISMTPKIAGLLDAVLTRGEIVRFGGPARFAVSAALELVFSFLLGAISTIRVSIFMLGLAFGKTILWGSQRRDAHEMTFSEAAQALWPQLVFGLFVICGLAATSLTLVLWSLPLTAGYLLAIPFAVITASPSFGRFMQRYAIAAIPEDLAPPPEIVAVQSPAVSQS